MGLFDAPDDPRHVGLDPNAQALLDQSIQRASASPEEFANRTSGEAQGRGLLQNDAQADQESARAGGSDAFGSAIRQKYQQQANYGMDRIKKINDLSARMRKSGELQQYAKAALGQQSAMTQQMAFLTEAYNQQEAARAGFINSLFQTVNTGMGMMAGKMKKPNTKPNTNPVPDSVYGGGGSVGGYGGGPTTVSDMTGFMSDY